MSADNPLDAQFHPEAAEAIGTTTLDEAAGDLQRAAAEGELSLAAETVDPVVSGALGSDAATPRDEVDAPPSADVLMDPGTGVLVRIGSVAGAAPLPEGDMDEATDPTAAEALADEADITDGSQASPASSSEPAAFDGSQAGSVPRCILQRHRGRG